MEQACNTLKKAYDILLDWMEGQNEATRLTLDRGAEIVGLVYMAKYYLTNTVSTSEGQHSEVGMKIEMALRNLCYNIASRDLPEASPVDVVESQLKQALDACQRAAAETGS